MYSFFFIFFNIVFIALFFTIPAEVYCSIYQYTGSIYKRIKENVKFDDSVIYSIEVKTTTIITLLTCV